MKSIITTALTLSLGLLLFVSTNSYAQDFSQEKQHAQTLDPKNMAKQLTDKIDNLVNLSEKQYKKIYKINLTAFKSQINNMFAGRMGQGGPNMGGGRPPMGQGGPGMGQGGPGMEGGMPQMGEMNEERSKQIKEDIEEARAKKAKKYKKVLDAQQYQKWMQFENEKMEKEFWEK
ncbi:MAG: hypothetical protein M0R23_05475 [Bacteroidales bacterium]|nr:hypothetical protein [Bacteroidales bacterium]